MSHKSIMGRARLDPTKYHRQDSSSLNPPFSLSLSFSLKVSFFTFTFTGWTRQSITGRTPSPSFPLFHWKYPPPSSPYILTKLSAGLVNSYQSLYSSVHHCLSECILLSAFFAPFHFCFPSNFSSSFSSTWISPSHFYLGFFCSLHLCISHY